MTDRFSLTFCRATVNVRCELPGPALRATVLSLLRPAIELGDPIADPLIDIVLVEGAWSRLSGKEHDALRRFPQLRHGEDGPTLTLMENRPERRVILRHDEPDAEDLHLTYEEATRTLVIGVESAGMHLRAVARTVKQVLGSLARKQGAVVLHGACVARDGAAHVLLGPRGAGKSSLSFVLATRAGWDFLSDDLVFVFLDEHDDLSITGWPSRIGVATNLLREHRDAVQSLRRYPEGIPEILESPWSADQRRRVYLDADEFLDGFGVSGVRLARPCGWVFPRAQQHRRGWRIAPARRAETWLDDNGATIRQLQHSSDLLGLLGHLTAGVTTATGHPVIRNRLLRLPAVSLDYGPDLNREPAACWRAVDDALRTVVG